MFAVFLPLAAFCLAVHLVDVVFRWRGPEFLDWCAATLWWPASSMVWNFYWWSVELDWASNFISSGPLFFAVLPVLGSSFLMLKCVAAIWLVDKALDQINTESEKIESRAQSINTSPEPPSP